MANRFFVWVFVMVGSGSALFGCGSAQGGATESAGAETETSTAAETQSPASSPEQSAADESAADDNGAEAETAHALPPPAPGRLYFDLAAHVARAELRHGETQVIDFGTPGSAKYTLGGWRTRVGDNVREGDVTASPITSVTGHLIVPSDRVGPRTLRMRARAIRDGRLTLYVDGETVGHATLPTDGTYTTVEVELDEAHLARGENMIQLRVPRSGSVQGLSTSAGILIDWVRLGAADDPHAEEGPPAFDEESESLDIPAGWTLGYTVEVHPNLRLRGAVESGALEVVAHRDGRDPMPLGQFGGDAGAGDATSSFDIDLSALEGSIVRLDLVAHGDLQIGRPRIEELETGPVRERRVPQNVIVYLTDTLRADKLRPYNPETRVQTPELNSWVENAALMVRGHTQENWTKPSVATLLSGLFPWEHNATTEDAVIPRSVDLMGELLIEQGFHTGSFIANGFCSDRFGFDQGWRTYRNYIREGRRTPAQFVAADVLDWLDRRPEDKPFFLYVHTIDPHVPYIPPDSLLELYDPEPYRGPVSFTRNRLLLEEVKIGRQRLTARDRQRLEALYDGEITYHDTHFGSIMNGLESRGLADDTLIVFTADHGEEFFDHDSVGHGHSVYEELTNVPLLVKIPGVTEGVQPLSEVVGLVDVLPTIFDAMGFPIPESVSGESFLPLLLGEGISAPRFSVTGFMEGWRAANVGRLKLIQRTASRIQLFDLEADPGETNDIAAEHPIAVRYVRGLLGLGLAEADGPRVHRRRTRPQHRQERAPIDDITRQQLEQLGYVGASRPQAPPEE